MSVEKETLQFKIGVSGTYWDKKPHYTIWVDDQKYIDQTIAGHSNEVEFSEFSIEITEGPHIFKIRLENKSDRDVEKDGHGTIVNDMLLNIESIEIDGIDLGQLKWSLSEFRADHEKIVNGEDMSVLKECVNLGWNGTYEIKFDSPFYLWLLTEL